MRTTTFLSLLILVTPLAAQELTPREIAALGRPAVVLVTALSRGQAIGQGSGFFVSDDGRLLTSLHVVEGADQLRVELPTGEIYDRVFFVSADERRDLAILRAPTSGLTPLSLGDDRTLEVGDPVYVLGNPMGLEGTFSSGLVSAKRMVEGVSLLQITAPISHGSSGGPVLNAAGEAVGVATLTFRHGQNLNIAVPTRYAADLLLLNERPRPFEEVAREIGTTSSSGLEPTEPTMSDLEPWVQVLVYEMATIDMAAQVSDLVPTHDRVVEMLDGYEYYAIPLTFRKRGALIAVAGVCDIDCTDLDLAVYDSGGRKVVADTGPDDRPIVRFMVHRPGTYKIVVHMVTCRQEPCGFAVQAYTRPDPR